jgi:hypothetical protein
VVKFDELRIFGDCRPVVLSFCHVCTPFCRNSVIDTALTNLNVPLIPPLSI